MKTISKSTAVAAVAGLVLSNASHADEYLREVAIQLAGAAAGEQVVYTRDGELRDGRHQDLRIHLESGVSYRFYGACDRDCGDLDFELRDPNGRLIDRDVGPDDVPIVERERGRSAYYTLRVSMANCSANPCTYGVVAVAW